MGYKHQTRVGFTIVELLIVIVVIGILAAITIVAYSGIQSRARAVSASSALTQSASKIALFQVENNDDYPINLSDVGVRDTGFVNYQYTVDNIASPKTYCITASVGTTSYRISNTNTLPQPGGCAGHGVGGQQPITNLVTNPSFELDTNGWGVNIGTIQNTAGGNQGSSKLLLTRTGSGDTHAYSTFGIALISNVSYVLSFWAWADTAQALMSTAGLQEAGGSYRWIAYQNSLPVTTTPTRYIITGTAPADAIANSRIILRTGLAINSVVYYDGIMLTTGTSTYGYADGATANWMWSGALHNSASNGPAL